MTGQTLEDACRQYRQDRDPWDPIFEFMPRTLGNFAAPGSAAESKIRAACDTCDARRHGRARAARRLPVNARSPAQQRQLPTPARQRSLAFGRTGSAPFNTAAIVPK
jgi:hypothetical protein